MKNGDVVINSDDYTHEQEVVVKDFNIQLLSHMLLLQDLLPVLFLVIIII